MEKPWETRRATAARWGAAEAGATPARQILELDAGFHPDRQREAEYYALARGAAEALGLELRWLTSIGRSSCDGGIGS